MNKRMLSIWISRNCKTIHRASVPKGSLVKLEWLNKVIIPATRPRKNFFSKAGLCTTVKWTLVIKFSYTRLYSAFNTCHFFSGRKSPLLHFPGPSYLGVWNTHFFRRDANWIKERKTHLTKVLFIAIFSICFSFINYWINFRFLNISQTKDVQFKATRSLSKIYAPRLKPKKSKVFIYRPQTKFKTVQATTKIQKTEKSLKSLLKGR